jgi:hypothetical protein
MIRIVPITLAEANATVREWHSHHKPVVGHKFSIGATLNGALAGVVIVSRPVAPALADAFTMEVTRLCCRGGDKNVASRLLGTATTACEATGIRRVVSYTRVDEDGTCYKAAGWVALFETKGRPWTGGNKSTRWLPGFYEPSTEIIDRTRWEWRPPQAIRAVCKAIFALGQWARATERRRAA